MTTLKRLTTFYLIDLLILTIILIGFASPTLFWFGERGFWALPLIFVLLGQALGFVAFLFIEDNKKKNQTFFICAIVASVAFTSVAFSTQFSKWKHQRDYGNVDWNKGYIKYLDEGYKDVVSLAFDTLANKFNNPNDFRLIHTSVSHRDTSLNGAGETVYSVQLFYERKNDNNSLNAKVAVLRNVAQLLYFDKPLTNGDEDKEDSLKRKLINDFRSEVDSMPDSVRRMVRKEFKDVLEQ